MEFALTEVALEGVPVLRVTGAVDLQSAPLITERLAELVREPQIRVVVVDLSEVWFFDSSGLSALDEGQTAAAEQSTSIGLVCQDPKVLRLFDITGLADRFVISPTAELAVQQ